MPKTDQRTMVKYKVLYISGSIGLGHVVKDLAIADKLRALNPDIEVVWIATDPAIDYLENKGEKLHELSYEFSSYSAIAEKTTVGSKLNLANYVLSSLRAWLKNIKTFRKIIRKEPYDIVVGNETYEILIALIFKILRFKTPFVIIYDFLGLDSMTRNPVERIVNYILNWIWSRDYKVFSRANRESIFIGEPEDIPDRRFGFMLPNRREYAKKHFTFIGYVIRFDPGEYSDRKRIRKTLGYDDSPLIICGIGGTSIGRNLLELCNNTYPIMKSIDHSMRMILVTGPRLDLADFSPSAGVEIRGFVPDLFMHFAACDLAIVQGGFSSTLELTSLRRPFVYFPIEGHSEQEYVAKRLDRHKAGIRMKFSETTPEDLANQILNHMGKPVNYNTLNTNGAKDAAHIINKFLR